MPAGKTPPAIVVVVVDGTVVVVVVETVVVVVAGTVVVVATVVVLVLPTLVNENLNKLLVELYVAATRGFPFQISCGLNEVPYCTLVIR